jgi:predicted nucleic acid-binding protein
MAAGSDAKGKVRFVLDCSVALAWCFPDEKTKESQRILRSLKKGTAVVPSLWFLEVSNALLVAERRGRITAEVTAQALKVLGKLPIEVDDHSGFPLSAELLAIAREYGLSAYDAAYLELARRLSLPLVTLDKRLQGAVKDADLPSLGA